MLKNKAKFTAYDLAAIFGTTDLKNIEMEWEATGVTTDTRILDRGEIFVAIRGEKFDGHDKITEAFEKGASACIADRAWFGKSTAAENMPLILSGSAEEALGKLARYHRRKFDMPVVAVGGSNGKTSTKDIIAHVLSAKFNTHKTKGNFNNQIGMPLVALQMEEGHEIAVVEIGTNSPGEIAVLCEILDPTHGIITNIAEEHLEQLIDLVGVELEETYLFGYLHKKSGTSFVNTDDEILIKYLKILEKKFTFGSGEDADVRYSFELDNNLHPLLSIKFGGREFSAKMKTYGSASAKNGFSAAAVGLFFGLSDEEIKSALETYEPDASADYGRMRMEETGGIRIINDSYNANPESMRAAFEVLKNLPCNGKKYAAIADMLELGVSAGEKHRQILREAALSADLVLIHSSEMLAAYDSVGQKDNIFCFESREGSERYLQENLKTGDIVLVKGSRGMKMEKTARNLREKFTGA